MVLPWPEPFPDFVGVVIQPKDGGWERKRTDKEWNPNYDPEAPHTPSSLTHQVEQYGMEFHPDVVNYPDIARVWFKDTIIGLPKDVPAGSKCESLPLHPGCLLACPNPLHGARTGLAVLPTHTVATESTLFCLRI